MKTNATIRIVIWSLVLLVLLAVLLAGMSVKSYNADHRLTEEIAAIHPADQVLLSQSLSLSPDGIREICIDWVAGDILLISADVEQIEISESDVRDETYALTWNQIGEKLEIRFCQNHNFSLVGINSNDFPVKDLVIKVPREWAADSLEINAASASLEVREMTIRQVDFDGASGTCDFINCEVKDLDVDTASGDVTFSGTLDSLDFDSASASFLGEFQNTPSRMDMDGMSGSLDIALPEDCGYSLDMDGMDTSFRSDFYGTENRNGSHVYGNGRCVISVDGMSCDVIIRKLETIAQP